MRTHTSLICLLLSLLLLAGCVPAALAEDVVTIALNGDQIQCNSANVLVEGTTAHISFPGDYEVTGKLDNGQLAVESTQEGKITLILNNVEIHNETGPAIWIGKVSPRASIRTAENSVNTLTTGSAFTLTDDDEPNGALFSKSDLTVTGTGTLNVVSGYMDGIVSKDDLRIKSGTLNVTAPRNGLRGKDYIDVIDGTITIVAGNDGMKSTNDTDPDRGYVKVGGGTINITCTDDPISVVTKLTITGGVIDATIVEDIE